MNPHLTGVGSTMWVVADGYIPPGSSGPEPEMTSHDSICMLNPGDAGARVEVYVYFTDRDPVGPYVLSIAPRRAFHQRINDLEDPEPIPVGTDYCLVAVSDVPIVVQHTRLDSRQEANALMSTIAFPAA
ncbi:sensory rhodopsin transducer [Nonomuraea indica]|uniref:Sensory rhodopsin transducer n=1 Tax=Nonomuraea indica TaxID=1581193 RepID=A0ABW8A836_9ACTN